MTATPRETEYVSNIKYFRDPVYVYSLKQGIEVMIKEAVPEIVAVVDQTDHASGTNPYYQPAK